MSRRQKLFGALIAIAAVLSVTIALSLGPIVRGRAAQLGDALGVEVVIGGVRPTWGGLRLIDVRATSLGTDIVDARFREVRVGASLRGAIRSIAFDGGEVAVKGEIEAVRDWLRNRRGESGGGGRGGASGRTISAKGIAIGWSDQVSGKKLEVANLELIRGPGPELSANIEQASIVIPKWGKIDASALTLASRLEGKGSSLKELRAGQLHVELNLDGALARGAGEVASAAETEGSSRPGTDEREAKWVAYRARLVDLVGRLAAVLTEEGRIGTEELYARIRHGAEALHVGPGRLSIGRESDRVIVDVVAGGGEGRSPLRVHADLPTEAGEIIVKVEGGPVTLASLGARDGEFGLIGVDGATLEAQSAVVLSGDARSLIVDANGRLRSFGLMDKRLADEPVRGIELGWRAKGALQTDGSAARIDMGEVSLGAIRFQLEGQIEREAESTRARVSFAIPHGSCQSMLDSVPRALVPRTAEMTLGGAFSMTGQIAFDTRKLDALELDWNVRDSCRITSVPTEHSVARFRRPFRRMAYDGEGNRIEVLSGPGTSSWAPFDEISPFVEAAVMTTEDGRFRRHSGFDKEAIKSAVRDNLKAGRFVRGASTISMQLAKNLYLDRGKTLSRKLEEVLLTAYLEQELTKDEILELYFNIVELGPMVYGIGPAAEHYFNTSANELSLGQALYLVSTLPNPKRQYFGSDGRVSERWTSYLHKLMRIMLARHRITEREYADGLSEIVTFGVPHSPRRDGFIPVAGELDDEQDSWPHPVLEPR